MKATLKFDRDTEEKELRLAIDATEWALVTYNIWEHVVGFTNDGHNFQTADDAIDNIMEFINDQIEDKQLSFDDIP